MLIQDLIPKPVKEFLVFWRKNERLPGHRAFSKIALINSNIDHSLIFDFYRLKNCDGYEQQRAFYDRYNAVRLNHSVSHLSQRYIAWRDSSTLLFLLCCVSLPVLSFFDHARALPTGLILSGTTGICFLLTAIAAQNSAKSLVVQVLTLPRPQENTNGE